MQIGQVVDYVIVYNKRQKGTDTDAKGKKKIKKRKATQADIDAFFG